MAELISFWFTPRRRRKRNRTPAPVEYEFTITVGVSGSLKGYEEAGASTMGAISQTHFFSPSQNKNIELYRLRNVDTGGGTQNFQLAFREIDPLVWGGDPGFPPPGPPADPELWSVLEVGANSYDRVSDSFSFSGTVGETEINYSHPPPFVDSVIAAAAVDDVITIKLTLL